MLLVACCAALGAGGFHPATQGRGYAVPLQVGGFGGGEGHGVHPAAWAIAARLWALRTALALMPHRAASVSGVNGLSRGRVIWLWAVMAWHPPA